METKEERLNRIKMSVEQGKKDSSKVREAASDLYAVSRAYSQVDDTIEDIEAKFKEITKLDGKDIAFLLFAVGMQCVRQYLVTHFTLKDERPNDQEAAKDVKRKSKEHSDRKHRYYNPSVIEILTNPVPFDTVFGSKEMQADIGGKHRYKTLGHDPILGWVFGTANIATSTLTKWNFQTFHVKTGYTKNNAARDKLVSEADTKKMFDHMLDKLTCQGAEGKEKVALAVIKEAIHLKSDVKSKDSLAIPIVQAISYDLAQDLADFGIDTANLITVGKQAGYAALINFLISALHRLCYDEKKDGDINLYKVRTRKILLYSNVIASASNVLAVAIVEAIAICTENPGLAKQGAKYIDLGGYIITVQRLISDQKFINQIKTEFVEKEFDKKFAEIVEAEKQNGKL